jgi:hypothetical protein
MSCGAGRGEHLGHAEGRDGRETATEAGSPVAAATRSSMVIRVRAVTRSRLGPGHRASYPACTHSLLCLAKP